MSRPSAAPLAVQRPAARPRDQLPGPETRCPAQRPDARPRYQLPGLETRCHNQRRGSRLRNQLHYSEISCSAQRQVTWLRHQLPSSEANSPAAQKPAIPLRDQLTRSETSSPLRDQLTSFKTNWRQRDHLPGPEFSCSAQRPAVRLRRFEKLSALEHCHSLRIPSIYNMRYQNQNELSRVRPTVHTLRGHMRP